MDGSLARALSRPTTLFAAASTAAVAMVAMRIVLSGAPFLSWMTWNLFLAWVPYALASLVARLDARRPTATALLVPPALAWLLFFPNAPYIVTDFVHLRGAGGARLAYDAVLIGFFAVLGLALGLASLARMQAVVARRLGPRAGWAFAGTVSLLAGIGIWMGRVLRWNSWDVLTNPMGLFETTAGALLDPASHLSAIAFSASFGATLLAVHALGRTLDVQATPSPAPPVRRA